MKQLTKKLLILLFFISTTQIAISNVPVPGEVIFTNRISIPIYITCYPISLVFDGNKNYSVKSEHRYFAQSSNLRFDYNNGVYLLRNLPDTTRIKKTILYLPGHTQKGLQFDLTDNEENYGSIGFGKYKIKFYTDEELYNIIDSLTLEYDSGYGQSLGPDINFYFNALYTHQITFNWTGSTERYIDASDVNRTLVCWNQYEGGSRTKDLGNFTYNTSQ